MSDERWTLRADLAAKVKAAIKAAAPEIPAYSYEPDSGKESVARDGRRVCPQCGEDIESISVEAIELLPDNYFGWREVVPGPITAHPCGHRVRAEEAMA